MNDPTQKMSRRDWFRLGNTNPNRMLAEGSGAEQEQLTKPTELPPNHDGLNLEDLPPLREAVLDQNQVDMLFADVRKFATEISLMQQGSRTPETAEALTIAEQAFREQRVNRIQIRYRWQNAAWIDTLHRKPEGIKLVRIQHAQPLQ